MFSQVLATWGNLSFSMETAPCWNMPLPLSVWEQISISLLSLTSTQMMHPFYWFSITQSHFPPTFVSKTSGWSGNVSQPDLQAEALGNSFHSHPILTEDGKLGTACLDSLVAWVLDAIHSASEMLSCEFWLATWVVMTSETEFHTPLSRHQVQGWKPLRQDGWEGRCSFLISGCSSDNLPWNQ